MPTLLLLALGVAAVIVYAQTSSAATSSSNGSSSSSWPPSAAIQQNIYNQVYQMAVGTGQALPADFPAQLQALIAQAPQAYLEQGGIPNAQTYQQWAITMAYQGVMGGSQILQGGGPTPLFPPGPVN